MSIDNEPEILGRSALDVVFKAQELKLGAEASHFAEEIRRMLSTGNFDYDSNQAMIEEIRSKNRKAVELKEEAKRTAKEHELDRLVVRDLLVYIYDQMTPEDMEEARRLMLLPSAERHALPAPSPESPEPQAPVAASPTESETQEAALESEVIEPEHEAVEVAPGAPAAEEPALPSAEPSEPVAESVEEPTTTEAPTQTAGLPADLDAAFAEMLDQVRVIPLDEIPTFAPEVDAPAPEGSQIASEEVAAAEPEVPAEPVAEAVSAEIDAAEKTLADRLIESVTWEHMPGETALAYLRGMLEVDLDTKWFRHQYPIKYAAVIFQEHLSQLTGTDKEAELRDLSNSIGQTLKNALRLAEESDSKQLLARAIRRDLTYAECAALGLEHPSQRKAAPQPPGKGLPETPAAPSEPELPAPPAEGSAGAVEARRSKFDLSIKQENILNWLLAVDPETRSLVRKDLQALIPELYPEQYAKKQAISQVAANSFASSYLYNASNVAETALTRLMEANRGADVPFAKAYLDQLRASDSPFARASHELLTAAIYRRLTPEQYQQLGIRPFEKKS